MPTKKITPCLWFDHQAEEAAKFYSTLFKKSKVGRTAYYGAAGAEASGQRSGSVMTVEFELDGLSILGLNGGPHFQSTPALSLFVWCASETEIDKLWRSIKERQSAHGIGQVSLGATVWVDGRSIRGRMAADVFSARKAENRSRLFSDGEL